MYQRTIKEILVNVRKLLLGGIGKKNSSLQIYCRALLKYRKCCISADNTLKHSQSKKLQLLYYFIDISTCFNMSEYDEPNFNL